eukprot:scaffold2858_cov659-Pavlova_lutheri.AAC.87
MEGEDPSLESSHESESLHLRGLVPLPSGSRIRFQSRSVSGSNPLGTGFGGKEKGFPRFRTQTDDRSRWRASSAMGVQGLLPQLRDVARPTHVSEYQGRKAAVDAHGWLHRGAYGCAAELCEGKPTRRCVQRNAKRNGSK